MKNYTVSHNFPWIYVIRARECYSLGEEGRQKKAFFKGWKFMGLIDEKAMMMSVGLGSE
jgi:hypothetical protein